MENVMAHAVPGPTVTKFKRGQFVSVRAFGRWQYGTVVKLGRELVHVKFTTGTGLSHTRAFRPEAVRGQQS